MRKRSSLSVIGITAIAALLLAGCSSGGNSDAGESPSTEQPAGDPIVIASIGDLTGAGSISAVITQITDGEKAAVDYINNDLGGVDGRPIELLVCDSKTDPAATVSCAQQTIEEGVIAKGGLSVLWGENGIPLFETAGISSMNAPVSIQDSTNADISFPLGGGSAIEFPVMLEFWHDEFGLDKAVILADDNSSGRVQVEILEEKAAALGAELVPVYLPVGAADPTPYVAKAVQEDPDVIVTAASGAAAVAVYRALGQQGFPADKVMNQGAAVDDESFFSKMDPELIDGAYFTYVWASYDDTDDPEVATYREAMSKYGPNDGQAGFYQWGFSNIMTIYNIAMEMGAENLNADSLREFFLEVEGVDAFMGGPLSRANAPEVAPAAIQSGSRVMQFKDGKLTEVSDYIFPFAK